MEKLMQTLEKIGPLDQGAMEQTRGRVEQLIKPPGSLGRLEDIAVQLAGITGNPMPEIKGKAVIIAAADHGVFEEGVAANPREITAMQTANFVKGVTGVCAFAKQAGAYVIVADVGVAVDVNTPGVLNRKIRYGTANMAKERAMEREEAIQAITVGIELAQEAIAGGANLIAAGEMGIGNTTASAAILSVMGNVPPRDLVGVGAGLPLEKLEHKAAVIQRAIDLNAPDPKDPIDVLSKVGGLEIGTMAGVMLACGAARVPVVIDGFIATAAASIAIGLNPLAKAYMIPSHCSAEQGARRALGLIEQEALFDLGLRLGEGSGAVLGFHFVEAATYMLREMITFQEAGITL